MGFGGEDSESGPLVLGLYLVVSELLDEFGPSYHFFDRRYILPPSTGAQEMHGSQRRPGVPKGQDFRAGITVSDRTNPPECEMDQQIYRKFGLGNSSFPR